MKFGCQFEDGDFELFQHDELDQGFVERSTVLDGFGDPVPDPDQAGVNIQEFTRIRQADGSQIVKPVLLDGEGKRQKKIKVYGHTDDGDLITSLDPVYINFRIRRRIEFHDYFPADMLGPILPP